MSATIAATPPLKEYVCPVCIKRGKRNVLVRGRPGAEVEAFCRHCKFRRVVII